MFNVRRDVTQSGNMGLGPPLSGDARSELPNGAWRKSRACTASTCVEVRFSDSGADLRDSKQVGQVDAGVIGFSRLAWEQFLHAVDSNSPFAAEGVKLQPGRLGEMSVLKGSIELSFDAAEWSAFKNGVAAGEFALPAAIYAEAVR